MPDRAHTPDRAATLWSRLEAQLEALGVPCASCRALAREYVEGTDIYGTRTWETATRVEGEALVMEGILHRPGPAFVAVFKRATFGYKADERAACPSCGRAWRYRADYHFGMFDGALTLEAQLPEP